MERTSAPGHQERRDKELDKRVIEALEEIRYGTLTLVVQDGKVIQIDKSQKIRLI